MVEQKPGKMKSPFSLSVPEMEVNIKGLENHIFYYGKGMQEKCLESSKAFIDCAGRTCGESERQSIVQNRFVSADMEEPKVIKKKADFENMSFTDQELWKRHLDRWVRSCNDISKNLSEAFSALWALCHAGLQQKIKSDKDCDSMDTGDVGELHRIINKICHGNNSTDNAFLNLIDAQCNFMLVRAEECEFSSDCLEAFQKRCEALETCGGSVTTVKFRNLCMKQLESRGLELSNLCASLRAWEVEDEWSSSDKDEEAPRSAANNAKMLLLEQHKTHVCIKRSGQRHKSYRASLQNDCNGRKAECPSSVSNAHCNMDNCIGEAAHNTAGQTHLQQSQDFRTVQTPANAPDAEQEKMPTSPPENWTFKAGMACFRCDREGHLTRDCWFQTKEDGSPVNDQQHINKKFQEKETERRRDNRRRKNAAKTTDGSQNFAEAFVMPSVEECPGPDIDTQRSNNEHSFVCKDTESKLTHLDLSEQNHVCNQGGRNLKPYEVSLDSCSTCDAFVNANFLRDIRQCEWTPVLSTQNGVSDVTMIGELPGVGTVWYHPEGSANILSMHRMAVNSGWSMRCDTDTFERTGDAKSLSYRCETHEGVKLEFKPARSGLHVLDCKDHFEGKEFACAFGTQLLDNGTHFGMAMCDCRTCGSQECQGDAMLVDDAIDTIEKSKNRFAKRDQSRAKLVRRFQHVAGHPSDQTLLCAAATDSIKDSPIAERDVKLALEMLGKSEHALHGKRTRRQPDAVVDASVPVPKTVMDCCRNAELSVDVMCVNRIPFLVSVSKSIHCGTVGALDDLKIPTLESAITDVLKTHQLRGFHVTTIHVDIQFKAIRDRKTLQLHVDVVSREEHVPEIERFARVIKERARCCCAMPPHKRIPKTMVMHLLQTVVFHTNAFVWTPGASQFLPPITIVEGIALNFNRHFHVIFGECVHTHEGTTNDVKINRTVGAIALGPNGNLQGGIRCHSLLSGKAPNRVISDVTIMKMPLEAIQRLNCRARKQKAPIGLEFQNRQQVIDRDNSITGVDTTEEREPEPHHEPGDFQADCDIATADEVAEANRQDEDIDADAPHNEDDDREDQQRRVTFADDLNGDDSDAAPAEPIALENRDDEMQPPTDDSDSESEDESEEEVITTRSGRVGRPYDCANKFPDLHQESHLVGSKPGKQLRPCCYDENMNLKPGKGVHVSDSFHTNDIKVASEHKPVEETIKRLGKEEHQLHAEALRCLEFQPHEVEAMVHKAETMSVKQGIKRHGKEGKRSAMKEIKNLVDNECFGETKFENLTQEMKDKALPILMLMVLKRNGVLKTRGVADGSAQRLCTNKDDVSSPTPDFHAFKCTCAVIAKEARDVASVDLPGFFPQTDQDGNQLILLKLTGEVALLLVECDEAGWKPHLNEEDGRWVIHVICKKAIYGTMNAALLAHKKLAGLFKSWDLAMNPCDPCVWNGDVEGSQFTVVFHIDDPLMSHKSPTVITRVISKLDEECGKKDELTVTRGAVHEHLGMTVDFSAKGECAFSQCDFVKKLITSLPDSLPTKERNTPAPEHLSKVDDEESQPLDDARKDECHGIVARALWSSQRSRPDIQLATGFHCTRVKEPREHDWLKLAHLMGHIILTRHPPLIVSITKAGAIICMDGAHAVHADAKGHSGLFVTQGRGAMINVSKKLGVVTTSSTETEIVSTGERPPKCTWFRHFRLAQGEEEREDVLMQDNKSAIILQKNYPYSTRKGSKHIHVRYFFTVDKLHNKELKIVYCPTDKMVADYNSKPLQGQTFTRLRNEILGLKEEDFSEYKRRYLAVLRQYDLYDDSEASLGIDSSQECVEVRQK